ncbi:hypothetical protein KSF_077050 [Reticulibacter mediterranei]|uniref:Lipoprotein n=1 Tax=Reticulibacter mediterranei TaxID=2778369 RepID=A0A8J3N405_9CHLR|nr:hypothetical protein [Reticulibacter mediterranei]GHO97657.1 hypothetical protein KSF_077050 [Reticulibacter mediterranei]
MRLNRGMIWFCLFIICALAGCGSSTENGTTNSNTGANSTPTAKPDRVQIQVFEVDQKTASKTVTVSPADQVQQFYQTVNSMPAYPKDAVCTMEMGPRYTLIFSQGGKDVETVTAERYGCKKMMIGSDMRQGTQQFWQELDQMIAKGAI